MKAGWIREGRDRREWFEVKFYGRGQTNITIHKPLVRQPSTSCRQGLTPLVLAHKDNSILSNDMPNTENTDHVDSSAAYLINFHPPKPLCEMHHDPQCLSPNHSTISPNSRWKLNCMS